MPEHDKVMILEVGDHVTAFDPRTLGVIRHGWITGDFDPDFVIDFGIHGSVIVKRADITESFGKD